MKRSIFISMLTVFLAIGVCVMAGCSNSADQYKPVYKSTDETGKDIYDWPAADENGFIDVPGGKVAYRLYGKDKKGTPLICLHGGPGGNYGVFYRQICLAEERPVLLYNQLGSPDSQVDESFDTPEKVKSLYTIEHFTEELDAVVRYTEFNEFALLCTS